MQHSNRQLIEWHFKDHKITTHEIMGTELGRLEYMRWQKPGSWNSAVDYTVKTGNLIVTGDLGDAVYCWYSPTLSLEWIAGLNLHYFHSKCKTSELGRCTQNYEWDEDKARKYIFGHFRDYRNCKGYKAFKDACRFYDPLESYFSWNAWLHENDPAEYFGEDWWDWLPEIGNVMPIRTRLHLLGLKLAFNKKIKQ